MLILFNPHLRAYNLRLLLLAGVSLTIGAGIAAPSNDNVIWAVCFGVMLCVHHILALFFLSATLFVSFVFRLSTMVKAKGEDLCQKLRFLGSCPQVYPLYTPLSIVLNRSVARPLVKGESNLIILARAGLISCIAIVVPAFGVWSIFFEPARAVVYIQSVVPSEIIATPLSSLFDDWYGTDGNASIFLTSLSATWIDNLDPSAISITSQSSRSDVALNWSKGIVSDWYTEFQCSCQWREVRQLSISASLSVELAGFYLFLGLYFPTNDGRNKADIPEGNSTPVLAMFPGSHLVGLLTWSAKMPYSSTNWIYTPEIIGLQQDVTTKENISNHSVLTLTSPSYLPTKVFQEIKSPSILSGISDLGGFWTFVNGAFALLFGANIIYFAFGRRPLSALGVIHLFQRRALVRRWHEEFPELRTEGGLPGLKSAGIISFIRERLVDVGEEPPSEHDAEPQTQADMCCASCGRRSSQITAAHTTTATKGVPHYTADDAERMFEEIPLCHPSPRI